jgi:hypothetical protein
MTASEKIIGISRKRVVYGRAGVDLLRARMMAL